MAVIIPGGYYLSQVYLVSNLRLDFSLTFIKKFIKSLENSKYFHKIFYITVVNNTVCLKGQVKIYLLITRARKHSKTLERWHFLH